MYRARGQDGEIVAVKVIEVNSKSRSAIESLKPEVDLLKKLRHRNIVSYQGYMLYDKKFSIVLEYCANGSLSGLCRSEGPLGEEKTIGFVKDILSGLEYLHANKIIHRDIKGANLLIATDGTIKLADFGVATFMKPGGNYTVAGTPHWMAPEIFNDKGASSATDIWSLGITIFEMLTGHPPHHEKAPMATMYAISKNERPPIPENISEDAKHFLKLCFRKDPERRPTATQLLNHRWIVMHQQGGKSEEVIDKIPVFGGDLEDDYFGYGTEYGHGDTKKSTRSQGFAQSQTRAAKVEIRVSFSKLDQNSSFEDILGHFIVMDPKLSQSKKLIKLLKLIDYRLDKSYKKVKDHVDEYLLHDLVVVARGTISVKARQYVLYIFETLLSNQHELVLELSIEDFAFVLLEMMKMDAVSCTSIVCTGVGYMESSLSHDNICELSFDFKCSIIQTVIELVKASLDYDMGNRILALKDTQVSVNSLFNILETLFTSFASKVEDGDLKVVFTHYTQLIIVLTKLQPKQQVLVLRLFSVILELMYEHETYSHSLIFTAIMTMVNVVEKGPKGIYSSRDLAIRKEIKKECLEGLRNIYKVVYSKGLCGATSRNPHGDKSADESQNVAILSQLELFLKVRGVIVYT